MDTTKKILIISSADKPEDIAVNDQFIDQISQSVNSNVQVSWVNYHAIAISFSDGKIAVRITESGADIKDFDFVYFKSIFRHTEMANVIARYLRDNSVKFVCQELLDHIPTSKLSQLDRMSSVGVSIPATLYLTNRTWKHNYDTVVRQLGEPFVFKAVDAYGGGDNYLVRNRQEFDDIMARISKAEYIAQEFIANDCDYRVLVLEGQPKLIIKRMRVDQDTHLNNTSQGADAVLVDLADFDNDSMMMAVKAADVLRRDIAGVDVLFDLHTTSRMFLK